MQLKTQDAICDARRKTQLKMQLKTQDATQDARCNSRRKMQLEMQDMQVIQVIIYEAWWTFLCYTIANIHFN